MNLLHPMIIHFPIASLLISLALEGLFVWTKRESFKSSAVIMLHISALTAIFAVATGYIASDALGHDSPGHDLVHQHRDVMLAMSILLVILSAVVFKVRAVREGSLRKWLFPALLLVSALLVYGADKGGHLVFEKGVGVEKNIINEGHHDSDHDH